MSLDQLVVQEMKTNKVTDLSGITETIQLVKYEITNRFHVVVTYKILILKLF